MVSRTEREEESTMKVRSYPSKRHQNEDGEQAKYWRTINTEISSEEGAAGIMNANAKCDFEGDGERKWMFNLNALNRNGRTTTATKNIKRMMWPVLKPLDHVYNIWSI